MVSGLEGWYSFSTGRSDLHCSRSEDGFIEAGYVPKGGGTPDNPYHRELLLKADSEADHRGRAPAGNLSAASNCHVKNIKCKIEI